MKHSTLSRPQAPVRGLVKVASPVLVVAVVGVTLWVNAGDLNPPVGPVSSTMKDLDTVEPRTPIRTADLPLTINQSGSYYLAENITTAGGGISIAASDVTLDLNGYTLRGGTGDGILISGFPKKNIVVRNGTIAGWAEDGIDAVFSQNSQFENLRLSGNGGNGLRARDNSVISGCTAQENGAIGISTSTNCAVSNCTARSNGGAGISVGNGSTVTHCASEANTGVGIVVGFGSRIRYSVAGFNGDDGFQASSDAVVQDCTARNNTGDGVQISQECRALDNHCTGNGNNGDGAGIHATGRANRIERNYCLDADRGLDIDSFDNFVANNTVFRNSDNYDIAAGNRLHILLCQIPESIDWPAKVTLAGSLTGVMAQNGITINSDNVTIDLNGFALIGVPGSFDIGIAVPAAQTNLTVRNGTIRDWTSYGADAALATNSQFQDLRVWDNGAIGLWVGDGSLVTHCTATGNGSSGINTNEACTVVDCTATGNGFNGITTLVGCTVADCTARDNTIDGIKVGEGSTVQNCSAYSNDDDGIAASSGSTVLGCTAADNGDDGIITGAGCTVSNCSAYQNGDEGFFLGSGGTIVACTATFNVNNGITTQIGCMVRNSSAHRNGVDGFALDAGSTIAACTATDNTGDGIDADNDCRILGNTCDGNGRDGDGAGIRVISDCRVEGNNVTNNDRGIDVDLLGNIIIKNTASGNTTNYDILGSNSYGPIVNVLGVGDISGTPNADHPWANFEH